MLRNTIKCSQCNETFPGGFEYRMHWEKMHLQDAIEQVKKYNKKNVEQQVEKRYRLP
jgi:hypothetical protein